MNTRNIILGIGAVLIVSFLGYRMYITESARVGELNEKAKTLLYQEDLTPNKPVRTNASNGASSRQTQKEPVSKPDYSKPDYVKSDVIVYKSTEFENRNDTYYQSTYFILNGKNSTITVTNNDSYTFKYEVVGEVRDVFLGDLKIGYKVMINNKLLKSVSVFVLGELEENSILQEYHDGTMLEYFGISLIE